MRLWFVLIIAITLACSAFGQAFDERFEDWPVDLKINGSVFACSSESIQDSVAEKVFFNASSQSVLLLTGRDDLSEANEQWKDILKKYARHDVATISESFLDAPDVFEPWNVVVWSDGREWNNIPAPVWDRFAALARSHLDRGKAVVVAGSHAKTLSKFFISSVQEGHPIAAKGMDLFPDVVLETECQDTSTGNAKVLSILASHPRCVGIALEKNSVLELRGRKLRVWGEGTATLMLNANLSQPIRLQTIAPEKPGDRSAEKVLADLTQWRREAIDRTLDLFPPLDPGKPLVENGTLLIVGGGGLPDGLMKQFVAFAGGPGKARLVFVPCEESDFVPPDQPLLDSWKAMGAESVAMIHTKDRNKANADDEFLAPLVDATGIWFGGGRQWNLADSYYGTKAHRLMKEVLQRGGVIGGSSAGASIQARYLARATPIENFRIMAPGYERGGLGFISGVAIDQHFSQRGRQRDMTQLVNRYPQLLGIGIDEATALTVVGSKATVSGRGKVYFYDRRQTVILDRPDYVALAAGQAFDLVTRTELSGETGASGE